MRATRGRKNGAARQKFSLPSSYVLCRADVYTALLLENSGVARESVMPGPGKHSN